MASAVESDGGRELRHEEDPSRDEGRLGLVWVVREARADECDERRADELSEARPGATAHAPAADEATLSAALGRTDAAADSRVEAALLLGSWEEVRRAAGGEGCCWSC